jgi:3-hydroxybutyryl-CoA dehydratase
VLDKQLRGRGRRGEVTWRRQIFNQDGRLIMEGVTITLVEGRGTKAAPAGGPEEPPPAQPEPGSEGPP